MRVSSDAFHELIVSDCHGIVIYRRGDTASGYLLYIGYVAVVSFVFVGLSYGVCDRVSGMSLDMCGEMQKLIFVKTVGMYSGHLKNSFCKGSGLVKYDGLYFGKGFKVV